MLVRVASPAAPPLLGDVVIVVAGLVRLWEAGVRLMTPTSRSDAPEGPGKGGGGPQIRHGHAHRCGLSLRRFQPWTH